MTGLDDLRPIKSILSPALLAVAQGIVAGKTNAQIARERGTTENVIKQYTNRIYEATGCADRLELASRYIEEDPMYLRVLAARAHINQVLALVGL